MKNVQNKLYQLLTELKEICEKNGIPYFLGGWTALSAFCQGSLGDDVMVGCLAIWPQDAKKLIKALEKEGRRERFLEYPGNNENFPGFFLRYTAEDSLSFELYRYRGYEHYGISVNIHFLCSVLDDKSKQKDYDKLELGLYTRNGLEENKTSEELKAKAYALKWLEQISIAELFEQWLKDYSIPSKRVFCRTRVKPGFSMEGERSLFEETGRCLLAGQNYSMPKNAQKYITLLYGEKYEKTLKQGIKYPIMRWHTEVPYKRVFEEMGKDAVSFIKENEQIRENQVSVFQKFNPYRTYVNKTWNKVNAIAKVVRLQLFYDDACIKELENDYDGGDYREVYRILRPWQELNQFCKENGLKREDYIISRELEQMAEKYGVGLYPPEEINTTL